MAEPDNSAGMAWSALLGIQVVCGFGFGSYPAAMAYTTEQGRDANRGSNSGMFNGMSAAGQLTSTMLGDDCPGV